MIKEKGGHRELYVSSYNELLAIHGFCDEWKAHSIEKTISS